MGVYRHTTNDIRQEVLKVLPSCPDRPLTYISRLIKMKLSDGECEDYCNYPHVVISRVAASYIRHTFTHYDIIIKNVSKEEARSATHTVVEQTLEEWGFGVCDKDRSAWELEMSDFSGRRL